MSLFDLTGKVAIVTGATKGIGLGVSRQLVAHGARVVLSSRHQAECEALAAELNADRGGTPIAMGVACDLDRLEDMDRLARESAAAFGGVDILVCNAAVLPYIGPSADTPVDLFDRILISNTHHNFRLCQAVRAQMAERGGGSIILIGSIAGHTASPVTMAYSIAKAGVAHMARCLADELAAEKIRVNCVSPGFIHSFSSQPIVDNPAAVAAIAAATPLGRIGEPDDVAGAVVYLASAAGSYVTGASILVDGGRAALSPPNRPAAIPGIRAGAFYN
ncbi:MAG TPA: glucose 1-dehydrogenase [Caulobacteraceae bacterium]|jgi:NAD(P)-dependent dehydrogenase (short-subunit alcohol dehydrogenase family)